MAKWIVDIRQYKGPGLIFLQNVSIIVEGNTDDEVRQKVYSDFNRIVEDSYAITHQLMRQDNGTIPEKVLVSAQTGCRNIIMKVQRIKGS